ncbi:hypothetical protein NP534_02805 [Pseudomonas sp. 39004]|uniref:hypothetical protein n=1 Tax=Pseudomonas sp. 39004 TaxID=2967213 RepID=UPI002363B756|nr:hypothetical protein [Pseudomonas sp. 39004]MDD1959025.1 hypothetical protein [Pseudomonas sp. 39004]
MKKVQKAFWGFGIVSAIAVACYLTRMYTAGNFAISSDNQDWGGFGSYIAGIVAPAASLLAAYMVYIAVSSTGHELKLTLTREAIERLDNQLELQLNQPFYNDCHGDGYLGLPLKTVITDLSNKNIQANETSQVIFLALLHNFAILTNSIRHYIDLSNEIPTTQKNDNWLGDLEKFYWVSKYLGTCNRMIKIVGQEAFNAKISVEQLNSFEIVMRGKQMA